MKSTLWAMVLMLPVFSTPQTDEICRCLERAYASKNKAEAKKCSALREKQAKGIKPRSEEMKRFKSDIASCEANLGKPSPALSYDEMKAEVCNCFITQTPPVPCYQKQNVFSKAVGDRKEEFLQETNACAK